jgi:hypothetical protein
MSCPCCEGGVNCGCSCPGPFYGPVSAGYPEVPAVPPAPTVCNPSAPSLGDGWSGSFLNGSYTTGQILDPCWSPFPPYDANQAWCNLPASNWRMPDANGCDTEWVADTAGPYIAANCNVKVWLGSSARSNWSERSGEAGCECSTGSTGLEYQYRFFIINCETGLWEDKTFTFVKRNKYRSCSGGSVSSFGGADCSGINPAEALYHPTPIPPATLPGCNPLP